MTPCPKQFKARKNNVFAICLKYTKLMDPLFHYNIHPANESVKPNFSDFRFFQLDTSNQLRQTENDGEIHQAKQ